MLPEGSKVPLIISGLFGPQGSTDGITKMKNGAHFLID